MATYDKYEIKSNLIRSGWTAIRVAGDIESARSYLHKVAKKMSIDIKTSSHIIGEYTFIIAIKKPEQPD